MVSSFGQDEVTIKITADDETRRGVTTAKRNLDGLDGSVKSMRTNMLAMGAAVGVATLALVGAGRVIGNLAGLASDLEESQNKANVVFGESVDVINEMAATASSALGQTAEAVLSAAGTVGNLFIAMGLTQQAAAGMSTEIVQLSTDIASFQNISTDEALIALRAGLVGEAEPMRRLGVLLSAATVEAKAFELGLAKTTKELTEADKVQARYAIILEQTTVQQGDFARTSEGLANQQKTLNAQFNEFKTSIGEGLVGPLTAATGAASAFLRELERIGEIGIIPVAIELLIGGLKGGDETFFFGVGGPEGVANTISEGILGAVGDILTGAAFVGPPTTSQELIDEFFRNNPLVGTGEGIFQGALTPTGGFPLQPGFGAPPTRRFGGEEPSMFVGEGNAFLQLVRNRKLAETAIGSLSAAERALANERERVASNMLNEQVEAFLTGGEDAVDAVRLEQAALQEQWEEVATGMRENLGIEVPELFRGMWEQMLEEQRKSTEAMVAEERRLGEARASQAASNFIMILNAHARAGMLLPPGFGVPDVTFDTDRGPLTPQEEFLFGLASGDIRPVFNIQIGDTTFVDHVEAAIEELEQTGRR